MSCFWILICAVWGALGISGWYFTLAPDFMPSDFAMLPLCVVIGPIAWTTVQW